MKKSYSLVQKISQWLILENEKWFSAENMHSLLIYVAQCDVWTFWHNIRSKLNTMGEIIQPKITPMKLGSLPKLV